MAALFLYRRLHLRRARTGGGVVLRQPVAELSVVAGSRTALGWAACPHAPGDQSFSLLLQPPGDSRANADRVYAGGPEPGGQTATVAAADVGIGRHRPAFYPHDAYQ